MSENRKTTNISCMLSDIDHSRTKARRPQTNGICERRRDCDGKYRWATFEDSLPLAKAKKKLDDGLQSTIERNTIVYQTAITDELQKTLYYYHSCLAK
jgi:transposase InsO family protein